MLHAMFLFLVLGKSGVVFAVKLYPAGATTNSQDGVTDILGKCLPVLEEMVRQEMPLLVSSCSSSYMRLKVSFHLPIWSLVLLQM